MSETKVTPAERSGGYAVGQFELTATGNKSITGIGFKPKMVEFFDLYGSGSAYMGVGVMDDKGNQFTKAIGIRVGQSDPQESYAYGNSCLVSMTISGGASMVARAQYVSMDDDGFTINVTTWTQNDRTYGYIAYG